jgi:dihydrofolate reductase
MDRKVIVFIAMSADGFIAGPDDDLSWLSVVETPGEDYGYGDFIQTVDTVIMGRKTYDKVLTFGTGFPHKERKCFVVTRTRAGKDENVEYYNGQLPHLIALLQSQEGKHIFCDGGSEVISELMNHDLIDRFIISIIPVFLGSGTLLFRNGRTRQNLRLQQSTTFPSGLIQISYDRER